VSGILADSNNTPASSEETEDTDVQPTGENPWFSAVDQYRETAKWAIGALAAIGTLLAGTAPLAGIGNLEASGRWIVIMGAALGLTGVAAAIAAHVATLAPRTVYWHEIRAKRQGWFRRTFVGLGPLENILSSAAKRKSVLMQGVNSPADLALRIENLRKVLEGLSRVQLDPSATEPEKAAAAAAEVRWTARLETHLENQRELLRIGRFEKARTGFRIAFVSMTLGGILAGVGLGLLLYGLSDQSAARKAKAEARKTEAEAAKLEAETVALQPTGADSPEETNAASPLSAVLLSEAGRQALGASLGAECNTTAPVPVAILSGDSQSGSWDVVVVPGSSCASVRFTLSPSLGLLTD
jgi:hypothetical protein